MLRLRISGWFALDRVERELPPLDSLESAMLRLDRLAFGPPPACSVEAWRAL